MKDGRPTWSSGPAYEAFMGRWSALVAQQFLERVSVPATGRWLDLGCGSGILSAAVGRRGRPEMYGVDPAIGLVAHAAANVRGHFTVGDAQRLPFRAGTFSNVVSALVLNFIPDLPAALAEVRRILGLDGIVAAYVWDYGGRMQLLRAFWDAALVIDPASAAIDEGTMFTLCRPEQLERSFADAGFADITTWAIDIPTRFRDFDDYWSPFLGGTGPAAGFVMTLDEGRRSELRDRLRAALPIAADGSIDLVARAWAVRATRG